MYKIVGGDKQVYGPVSADELRRWIAEGRVNAQTQVQAEGSPDWKPMSAFPEFAESLAPHRAPVQTTPPAFIPFSGEAFVSDILARPAEVRIGSCLTRSWNLLMANFGLLFGAASIAWGIKVVSNLLPMGGLVYFAFHGILLGGLYLVFLKRIRGQPSAIGDVFSGFNIAFVQLLLAGIVSGLLSWVGFMCCLVLPGIYLLVAWTFCVPLVADKRLEFWSAMELSRKVVSRVWFQVFGLLIITFLPFLIACVVFAAKMAFTVIPIIQDLAASSQPDVHAIMQAVMPIVKTSFWIGLAINVVLLLNLPFAAGALMYAYEDLFGARPAPAA